MSTATVETLTAEVRVLMVGSRQITLSVYRQLDSVPIGRIDAFGRVRTKDVSSSSTELVGADIETGGLVRARTDGRPSWRMDAPDLFNHWWYHMGDRNHGRGKDFLVAGSGNRSLLWKIGSVHCPTEMNGGRECIDDMDAFAAEWGSFAEEAQSVRSEMADMQEWAESLPLIVLAGLR